MEALHFQPPLPSASNELHWCTAPPVGEGTPFFSTVQQGPPNAHNTPSFFFSLCCALHLLPVFAPLSSKQSTRHLFICAVGKDDPRLSKGMSQGHLQKLTNSPPVLWGKALWGPFLELTETLMSQQSGSLTSWIIPQSFTDH